MPPSASCLCKRHHPCKSDAKSEARSLFVWKMTKNRPFFPCWCTDCLVLSGEFWHSARVLLCGNSRWSENRHFKTVLCCHPVSLRCWKQEKKPKPVSQQKLEAAALPLGVLWILMTQTRGTVCLGTLWKEETRVCWAGIRCVLQAQWGWRAAAGYWWKTRLFSVRLLRGPFAGAAWGNNKYRWPKCVDMYLFDFFYQKPAWGGWRKAHAQPGMWLIPRSAALV